MKRLRLILYFCFLIMVVACLASCGNSTITEYSLPTSMSIPQGITAGPDGNIWFAETHSDKIGKATPSGKLTEYALRKLSKLSPQSSVHSLSPG